MNILSIQSHVAYGHVGNASATFPLQRLGFQVYGWSRSRKIIAGLEVFHGAVGLESFLRRSEILVCLLPSTSETRGILSLDTFRRLKGDGGLQGAYVINAARGDLQVDADVITALEEGTLAGATLDVFTTEPLPATSPLWAHPKVTITPHNSASSPRQDQRTLELFLENFRRWLAGEPLLNRVDIRRGY